METILEIQHYCDGQGQICQTEKHGQNRGIKGILPDSSVDDQDRKADGKYLNQSDDLAGMKIMILRLKAAEAEKEQKYTNRREDIIQTEDW